ncbi:hypothetical protein AMS68_007082 [Peltaster fructicola]|uniref:Uncharacterized protein n=1 Tax=Peltaster fructicola TaxID=286661 RepID=A0A6H0Y3R0_9PEZI|nr:hypothetical protein AMS68_007082 [Peltaster fructicola]
MSQFLANHAMENFFINPTMTQDTSMETFARMSIMEDISPKTRFDDFPLSEGQKEEKVRPVSTIQDLFLSYNFATSYQSEEELGSPRESSDDSMSLQSYDGELESPLAELELDSIEPSAVDLFLVPEELANSCTKIEHRCNRAQIVTLKPVGKPIMVSMPKIVDHKAGHHRRISIESYRSGIAASVRRAESRKTIKSRVSFEPTEPVPTLPPLLSPLPAEDASESVALSEVPVQRPRRQASVPMVRAATAFDSFPRLSDMAAGVVNHQVSPPRANRQAIAMKRSMTAPEVPEWTHEGNPLASARRGLHRITSSISTASDIVRRKTSMSSLLKASSPTSPTRHASLMFDKDGPRTPMGPVPARHSSIGKLTPRGPTERAPILVLPAFPDDEEDDDFGDASFDPTPPKWDRSQARQAAKLRKARPSIDGVVAHGMF